MHRKLIRPTALQNQKQERVLLRRVYLLFIYLGFLDSAGSSDLCASLFKHSSINSTSFAVMMQLTCWQMVKHPDWNLKGQNWVRVDVPHPLDPQVASSYGLQPTFGSPHILYLQGLLTAHPTGVKWTSKRETLHWQPQLMVTKPLIQHS